MKHIFLKALFILLTLSGISCSDDFLDKVPENEPSDATFFTQASDFQNYTNGLYDYIIRNINQSNHFTSLGADSDDLVGQAPFTNLEQRSNNSLADQTDASNNLTANNWNNNYTHIRSVNYMLNNEDNIADTDFDGRHYIGEGYFMRAFLYFRLLQRFGGVPYIDQVLGTSSEALYSPRESRDFIASRIIEDLDTASNLLQWKGDGAAAALGRINKEAALHLKTRVGLYEGSWEFYHGQKSTPFAVNGNNGFDFLNAAVEAGAELIAHQGGNIYVGPSGDEYSRLFNNDEGGSLPGVFLFRDFNTNLGVGGNRVRSLVPDRFSLTKSAVDNYLMSDGLPAEISTVTASVDIADQNSVINNRDPRLRQTLYTPDRGQRQILLANILAETIQGTHKPPVIQDAVSTGYYIWKGTPISAVSIDDSDIDDVIYRYGESLLNYVEAKAILGTITQSDIDITINVLRGRVGATEMNLGEVNGWPISYLEEDGFDPNASNILNEIRRERRVELMLEGFRNSDLKRWAIYEDVINGYVPVSAYYQELVDHYNDDQNLIDAGYPESSWENLRYVEGQNSGQIDGYLTPFFNNSDFNTSTSGGYFINPDRDYLRSIPQVEISLYEEKAGVILTQNPGWL